jgi:hypothetical protein
MQTATAAAFDQQHQTPLKRLMCPGHPTQRSGRSVSPRQDRQDSAPHAAWRGFPVAGAATCAAQRIQTGTQLWLLAPNRKRLIALLHVLLKFAPPKAVACVKERAPMLCPCCGAVMKIVRTRIRAAVQACKQGAAAPLVESAASTM